MAPRTETFRTQSPGETAKLAQHLLATCKNSRIFAIFGDLGAGKTLLVQALCEALGVTDTVKSPTFSIVNEYHYPEGKVYHFDFYRIKNVEEAFDLGYEEYFDSGDYCFIEWPEMIEILLPEEYTEIRIEVEGENERKLTLTTDT